MKKYFLLGVMALTMVACSDDDNSTSTPVTPEPTEFSGIGAEYMPVNENQVQTYQFKGTGYDYDIDGTLDAADNSDREEKVLFGQAQTVNGISYLPVYYFENGKLDKNPEYFLGKSGTSVVGLEEKTSMSPTIGFPSTFKIGTEWLVNPYDNTNEQIKTKCTEHLASYTNKLGNIYNDVVKLEIHYVRQETNNEDNGYCVRRLDRKIDADLYFAKNIGLVDMLISGHNNSTTDYEYYDEHYGSLQSGSYSLSRKDKE